MDCSPFGRGHQHEDKLNVLISAFGRNMVVEPGNYAYDNSPMRKYVISTRAHNTIMVDGREQCTRRVWKWNPEDIKKKAEYDCRLSPDADAARDSYTAGYGHGKDLVRATHTRTTLFLKTVPGTKPFFVVADRLRADDSATHSYDSLWHLETCALAIDGLRFFADFGGGTSLSAAFSDPDAKIVDMKGSHEPYQGWMPISPPGPHEHRAIPTPVLKGSFSGAKRIVGVFMPLDAGSNGVVRVEAAADPAATRFSVFLADGREIALDESAFLP